MAALPLAVVGSREHLEAIRQVAQAAITLVGDRGLLPLKEDTRVGALTFTPGRQTMAEEASAGDPFLEACRKRGFAIGDQAEVLVVGTRRLSRDPAQVEAVRRLAAARPVVLVALREPYDLSLVPEARTRIAAYGDEEPLVEAALDVITGRLKPSGRLPVTVS